MEDKHRMFLQTFMLRGSLDKDEVKKMFEMATVRYHGDASREELKDPRRLQEFVITINESLKPYSMEIKKGISEQSGLSHYCLVNIGENSITKMASDYTVNQLELLKKIIEKIVLADDGMIGKKEILNLSDDLSKRISKSDTEAFLQKLKNNRWIAISDSGSVSLETRTILELDRYILETYPNMATKCCLCQKLCLQGHSCRGCQTKMHRECAKKYFKKDPAELPCPAKCGTNWTNPFTATQTVAASPAAASEAHTSASSRISRKRHAMRDNDE